MRRLWIGLTLASLVVGWIGVACSERPDQPPAAPNGDTPLHLGGGATGGAGSEASTNACVAARGVCMYENSGNLCPEQKVGLGPNPCDTPDTDGSGVPIDGGTSVQVCCAGFNDAGQPDAVILD
jgi:hypothetical protein